MSCFTYASLTVSAGVANKLTETTAPVKSDGCYIYLISDIINQICFLLTLHRSRQSYEVSSRKAPQITAESTGLH